MIPLHASAPIDALVVTPPQLRVVVGVYESGRRIDTYEADLYLKQPRFHARMTMPFAVIE